MRITVIFLALFLLSFSTRAAEFVLVQGGYSEGASVTVTFTGEDLNGDGQLVFFPGAPGDPEITALEFSFSGNSQVPAFTRSIGDFFGFVFSLDDTPLGDDDSGASEGVGINTIGGFSYVTGPGPLSLCDGVSVCGQVTGPDGSDTTLIALGASGYTIDGAPPVAPREAQPVPALPLPILLLCSVLISFFGLRQLRQR